jgi:hypothetical protein
MIPIRFSALTKTSSGTFELVIAQSFTWVARDLGPSVLALFKHRDRKEIKNRAFPVITLPNNFGKVYVFLAIFHHPPDSKCEIYSSRKISLGEPSHSWG